MFYCAFHVKVLYLLKEKNQTKRQNNCFIEQISLNKSSVDSSFTLLKLELKKSLSKPDLWFRLLWTVVHHTIVSKKRGQFCRNYDHAFGKKYRPNAKSYSWGEKLMSIISAIAALRKEVNLTLNLFKDQAFTGTRSSMIYFR